MALTLTFTLPDDLDVLQAVLAGFVGTHDNVAETPSPAPSVDPTPSADPSLFDAPPPLVDLTPDPVAALVESTGLKPTQSLGLADGTRVSAGQYITLHTGTVGLVEATMRGTCVYRDETGAVALARVDEILGAVSGDSSDPTPDSGEVPTLEALREVGNELKELCGASAVLRILQTVAGTRKLSEVPDDRRQATMDAMQGAIDAAMDLG